MTPKNNTGLDRNFFQTLTFSETDFPDKSQITIPFRGQSSFSLLLYTNSNIQYSFNGNTVHGDMRAGTGSSGLFFNGRVIPAIWFKVTAGESPAEIRIEAW